MAQKRVQLSEETKKMLMSKESIPAPITIKDRTYWVESYEASGFKGVVWKGKDSQNTPVAIKFTIGEDYVSRSLLQETDLSRKLRGYPRFAASIDAGTVKIGDEVFAVFIEEWIEGPTLESFIASQNLSSEFLIQFISMMSEALFNLQFNGLSHDDLRAANIKIAPPKPGSLTLYESEVKIIDMGSLKPLPSKKQIDDHNWLIQHIVDIRNAIYRKKHLSLQDKDFLIAIVPILNSMLDDDKSVALREPSKIQSTFWTKWINCCRPKDEREQKLDDPFSYISSEVISSDKLLVDLFAESCPWKTDVLGPDELLLTGPRGCGKSTLFRRLSLKGMLHKGEKEILDSGIAGFYVSCNLDVRNQVSWITSEYLARKFRRELRHYFNLLLTKEIVSTFRAISTHDFNKILGLNEVVQKDFHRFLIERMGIAEADRMRLQGMPPMAHVLELVTTEMVKCHDIMVRNLSIPEKKELTYITDLVEYLNKNISYFQNRKTVFFIDDLSSRIIPKCVQHVFNDIILERAKYHVFKISSDKYGWSRIDSSLAIGDRTREYREIDCAKFFLVDANDATKRSFTEELLAKRLSLSGYAGTPQEIIGHSRYDEGSLGRAMRIRANRQKKKMLTDVYYGLETITDLSCGDISIVLEIYRKIFKKGKVGKNTRTPVPAHVQHEAIASESKAIYNNIKDYPPHGSQMFEIVTNFGKLSRLILLSGKSHKQGEEVIYPQTSRIEVDEIPEPKTKTSDQTEDLEDELIRRAVFIELDPGRSRHGFTPSLRWQLRPMLCPTFSTAPSKNIAIKWTPEEFKYFLTNPKALCQREWNEHWKTSEKKRKDEEVLNENLPKFFKGV